MGARLGRRHAQDAEERTERDRPAVLVPSDPRVRIKAPEEWYLLALGNAEPGVQEEVAPAGVRESVRADSNLVDPDRERLACADTCDRDRPDERVSTVEVRIPRLEFAPCAGLALAPARVERR